jgi:AraC-like DNA-binding protein
MSQVPIRDRLDSWVAAVNSHFVPLYVTRAERLTFEFEMTATQLGPIGVARQRASAHHCGRGRTELSRSSDRSFNLMMSLDCTYGMTHRGDHRMKPGDVAVHFSEYPIDLAFATNFHFVNLTLPEHWIKTWVPNPHALAGRSIQSESPWGAALSSFLRLLSPEYVADAPIAHPVLVDQLGALLALATTPFKAGENVSRAAELTLKERIVAQLDQRCQEESLTAEQVATALGVSVRTLHRALAANGSAFGGLLIEARVRCALRMLQSPAFNRLTTAEIGRRAGFANPSHFARCMRNRLGRTPLQLRSLRVPIHVTDDPRPLGRPT